MINSITHMIHIYIYDRQYYLHIVHINRTQVNTYTYMINNVTHISFISLAHIIHHTCIYDNQSYSQVISIHSSIASDPVHDSPLLVIYDTMQISLICHANEMPCMQEIMQEILSLNPCNFISASPSSLNIFQSFHLFK